MQTGYLTPDFVLRRNPTFNCQAIPNPLLIRKGGAFVQDIFIYQTVGLSTGIIQESEEVLTYNIRICKIHGRSSPYVYSGVEGPSFLNLWIRKNHQVQRNGGGNGGDRNTIPQDLSRGCDHN